VKVQHVASAWVTGSKGPRDRLKAVGLESQPAVRCSVVSADVDQMHSSRSASLFIRAGLAMLD